MTYSSGTEPPPRGSEQVAGELPCARPTAAAASRHAPAFEFDRADQITGMLDRASKLDQQANVCRGQRRALLATLRVRRSTDQRGAVPALARRGPRTRHDHRRDAKSDAGVRVVYLLPVLRDELVPYGAA